MRARLRVRALVLSLLLVVQFFAGMITNLYIVIPPRHPGANAHSYLAGAARSVGWAITSGRFWLAVHAALGMLLAVGSVELIVVAARSRSVRWIWLSVAGCAFLIGAGFNGASFLVFGRDLSSLIMAGLFGLSLASYVVALYADGRRPSGA